MLFQNYVTRLEIAKSMSITGALEAEKACEENILRRFGAPSLIRHDREPQFMSEVF